MRYSEVEQGRSGMKLLRLGSCDFDFDAEHAVVSGESRKLETISEAVTDVFSGSRSMDFSVVLSPASVISFFSPVSDHVTEADKRRQLEADTIIIGGQGTALSVVAESVASGGGGGEEAVTWYHVAAVPAQVRRNVSTVLSSFSESRHHFITSMQAAARKESGTPAVAAVGLFDAHTEIAMLESSKWLFGATSTVTLPSDVAYAILNLALKSDVNPADLGRVYLYGDPIDEDDLTSIRTVVAAEVTRLDPLSLVRKGPIEEREGFDPTDYVLCLGAAL